MTKLYIEVRTLLACVSWVFATGCAAEGTAQVPSVKPLKGLAATCWNAVPWDGIYAPARDAIRTGVMSLLTKPPGAAVPASTSGLSSRRE